MRGLIDRGRQHGKANNRFLLLGSASIELLKQRGETLAGRISYLELHPLNVLEVLACDDLSPAKRFIVYAGSQRYPLGDSVEAICLNDLATLVASCR